MNKFKAVLTVLQKGGVVADPAKWKSKQIQVNALAPFILAIAALGGLSDAISADTAAVIAAGVIAVVNVVFTVVSTDKIGLQPKR